MDAKKPTRPPGTSIFKNVHLENGPVGISVSGGNYEFQNATFKNVGQPFDFGPGTSASITGTRIVDDPKRRQGDSPKSKGWQRARGVALPILCTGCGSISRSANYVFAGNFYNLWDNEEPCPKCGNPARLSEGTFRLARGTIEVLQAPDLTHTMLASLVAISNQFAAGELPAETALQEVERASPKAGEAIRKSAEAGVWLVGALIAFFSLVNGYHDFVENFGVDPVSVSADYILDRLLPLIDTPALDKRMQPGPPSELDSKGADPTQKEGVPPPAGPDVFPEHTYDV